MKPLLLTTYGLCLKTRDRKIVLVNQDSGARKEWLPTEFPHDSIIVENLGGFVTFPALRWLAANGVSLAVLDFYGRELASYLPDQPIDPLARLGQYGAYLNPESRLGIARFILEEKVGKPVPSMYRTWDDLLTFEGREATRFWADLGVIRDYPKARDPTNACLNYAFGLLGSRARLAIHRASLDSSVGFLHTPQRYKSALVYDVMEPFRAETVKVALAVKRELRARAFYDAWEFGVRLRPEGASRVARGFAESFSEKKLARFVERLVLRLEIAASHTEPSRTAPQTEGRTAALLSA